VYTARRSGSFSIGAGPRNASMPDTLMIVPSPLATMPEAAARVRFVGRQLSERHVVRDAGVVDEHGELLAGAEVGDHFHAGIRAKVRNEGANFDFGQRDGELF
jgi:hypothetical protein